MTPEQQFAKDVQDVRYLCVHFDEIFQGMKCKYEGLMAQVSTIVKDVNEHVQECETMFNAMGTALCDLEQRVRHLETGGIEEPPI